MSEAKKNPRPFGRGFLLVVPVFARVPLVEPVGPVPRVTLGLVVGGVLPAHVAPLVPRLRLMEDVLVPDPWGRHHPHPVVSPQSRQV